MEIKAGRICNECEFLRCLTILSSLEPAGSSPESSILPERGVLAMVPGGAVLHVSTCIE